MRNLDDDPPIITLSAGPVDAYPVVLRALSRPVTYDFDPSFQKFYESTVRKTAESLRTALPPVILQGEPVLGLEAAAAALIGADDVVLNLASGEYGKGFGFWAARHCRELVEIEVPYDDAIDPEAVSDMLKARPEHPHSLRLPPRYAVGDGKPGARDRRDLPRARRADHRGRGLLLRRHGRSSGGCER